jgi:hypothetical protein
LPLKQTSQSGEKPREPEELQVNADGLGFAVFSDIQQRREWSLSIDQYRFLTTYAIVTSHFVQTTAGRILVNQLMNSPDRIIPDHIQRQMDTQLQDIFVEQQFAEERSDQFNERLWNEAITELKPLKPLFDLPGIPGVFE